MSQRPNVEDRPDDCSRYIQFNNTGPGVRKIEGSDILVLIGSSLIASGRKKVRNEGYQLASNQLSNLKIDRR